MISLVTIATISVVSSGCVATARWLSTKRKKRRTAHLGDTLNQIDANGKARIGRAAACFFHDIDHMTRS